MHSFPPLCLFTLKHAQKFINNRNNTEKQLQRLLVVCSLLQWTRAWYCIVYNIWKKLSVKTMTSGKSYAAYDFKTFNAADTLVTPQKDPSWIIWCHLSWKGQTAKEEKIYTRFKDKPAVTIFPLFPPFTFSLCFNFMTKSTQQLTTCTYCFTSSPLSCHSNQYDILTKTPPHYALTKFNFTM